jgi:thiol:disulfide interchange protein/DsbC/DsbD-like thiol-disulfide interchange protein
MSRRGWELACRSGSNLDISSGGMSLSTVMRWLGSMIAFMAASVAVWAAAPPAPLRSYADVAHLHVQLVLPQSQLYPGGPNKAGLYFKLDSGWHIYWQNAGDSGEPPSMHWTLPDGVTATPLQFPAPSRLPLGPLMDFGYQNQVVFPFSFHVVPSAKPGPAMLSAKVSWLVCREVCIPGKADLGVRAQISAAAPAVATTSSTDEALWQRGQDALPEPLPASDKAVFQPTASGFLLSVETGRRETQATFFPADQDVISNPAPQHLTPTPKGLVLDFKKSEYFTAGPKQLNGLLELSGGRNYLLSAAQGTVVIPASASAWTMLLRSAALAFLGGLLLNLMPCVFPVLFLKGLALVNSGSEERHKLRAHGVVYTAGILVSFWALVAALLALRTAGARLGWGFQFQSPIFLALMASLLFFLGLSLAGQFEIGLTLTSAGGSLAAQQGYAGSFFTGVLAVIVATPCTAPFMGAAIGYALSAPTGVTFAIFTALGLGLAAPYVALTLQPAWTRLLPRPGAWMEVLKQAVSVPIFLTVIWLAWVLSSAYGANALAALLGGFLLLAVAGWFLGRWPAKRWATAIAGLIVAAAIALAAVSPRLAIEPAATAANTGSTTDLAAAWQPWSAAAVSRYQAQGRPVFVDFTASWCLSCQVNERIALRQPEVEQAFRSAHVALLKADWTRHDEAITQALTAMGRDGVPAYALYTPGNPDPQLLPEVLTPSIVLDALNKLPHTASKAVASNSN